MSESFHDMKLNIGILLLLLTVCQARIHELKIQDDIRPYIPLTSFGYYQGGYLNVSLQDFKFSRNVTSNLFGFTLEKVLNDALDPRVENYREKCILEPSENLGDSLTKDDIIFFRFDLKNKNVGITCSSDTTVSNLLIYEDPKSLPSTSISESALIKNGKDTDTGKFSRGFTCVPKIELPLIEENGSYRTQFAIFVPTSNQQGLYDLVFYSCANYHDEDVKSSFIVNIEEHNVGNYLSAGDMPLPALYTMMSIMFFLSAIFWIYILCKSRHPVFRIHYLMGMLVILKALALLFHGINYHYIEIRGEHVATWAILYYVTHLLKGSVLFITIILIGTGWTFIKHILSPKDKRIFMIVIPLQVFANVAEIIIDESEEGDVEHRIWLNVFTFVDLICCFAILFPIVWSIKHLQDASQTDGKAAINLKKLKLFRHFYIMIVCYIYFTRIIVYLLKMTVPFQYSWLDEMFREIATFVFFVVTGYKFRPASANPYFHVPEDDDTEIEIVFSQCGLAEGLTKLSRVSNETGNDDKDTLLISKREISYDYD